MTTKTLTIRPATPGGKIDVPLTDAYCTEYHITRPVPVKEKPSKPA